MRNTEGAPELSGAKVRMQNIDYLTLRELGAPYCLAFYMQSVINGMSDVFETRHVLKIVDAVIRFVAVLVIYLSALRTRAKEGFGNESVNGDCFDSGLACQLDALIAFSMRLISENFAAVSVRPDISDETSIRNVVASFKADNWKPSHKRLLYQELAHAL